MEDKKEMEKNIYYSWFFDKNGMQKKYIEIEELENKTFKVTHIKYTKRSKIINLGQYFKLLDKLKKEFYRPLDW